jgi:quercetin dioxygenase-like cupin family protein
VRVVAEEIIVKRGKTLVRRQRLEPGEDTGWHRDPHHRVTVVLQGDELAIELPDGSTAQRIVVRPGQVDWDEPFDRAHRGVNVGQTAYEEVAVFFLDDEDADPQPRVNVDDPDASGG